MLQVRGSQPLLQQNYQSYMIQFLSELAPSCLSSLALSSTATRGFAFVCILQLSRHCQACPGKSSQFIMLQAQLWTIRRLFSYEILRIKVIIPLGFWSFINGVKRCRQLLANFRLHFAPCLSEFLILLRSLCGRWLRGLLRWDTTTLLLDCRDVAWRDLVRAFQTKFAWVTAIIPWRTSVWTIVIYA